MDELARRAGFEWRNSWGVGMSFLSHFANQDSQAYSQPNTLQHLLPIFMMDTDYSQMQLPLKKKGGYLDVLYLDDDIRITRGNRGGLFVHFRPGFLEKATQPANFHEALLEEKIRQDDKASKKRWWRR